MLIEENGLRILTDPGSFTIEKHSNIRDVDVVLFTHEHQDHYHLESLRVIIANNPKVKILCNQSVGTLLADASIPHQVVNDGATISEKNITIEGIGTIHAPIHASFPQMANTGYLIAERFWYPGDALIDPKRRIEILALPVAGPWLKISEAIDYALALKPTYTFSVHDSVLDATLLATGVIGRWCGSVLNGKGVSFLELEPDKEYEF